MSPHSSLRESDLLFAELVVEQRLCSAELVSECVTALERLAGSGVSPIPSLGEILVQKGYLTPPQVERTVRLGKASLTTSQETETPLEASGARVGKYVKARKLGEGGMGEVWKAWDTELRRWVALKFLKGSDAEEKARFRREAQTAAKLAHPNIGAVYEATDDFIAMQFVEGQDLTTSPRDDRHALVEIVRQAALAVHFGHEQGVIHRDIKPANIMVIGGRKAPTTRRVPGVPRAPQVHAFVMDFGLAKSTAVNSKLSASGLIVGTPSYMSPEQARGSAKLDARTDVYSLGATLYELLESRPPFRDDSVYDLLKKVIEQEPKPPRAEEDLRTIVMKCLEKDSARRYASAQEFADDLGRYLSREAILAHPPSTAYRLQKWVARRKGLVTAAALAAVALGTGSVIGVWQWRKAKKAGAETASEKAARELAERGKREVELYGPAEKDLALLTMRFYQPDFRLGEKEFGEYEALEAKIKEQMKESGPSARGWWLIGKCREVYAKLRADEAYDEALRIDSNHAPSLLRKGRLRLERALIDRAMSGTYEGRRRRSKELAKEGSEWMRRGLSAAGQREGMDADLAEAYLKVILQWETIGEYCAKMLEKWRGADFREEFYLIRALAQPQSFADDMREALRLRPAFYEAYFWRGGLRRARGEVRQAIEDLTISLEINPRFADALLNRGLALTDAGRFKEAVDDYTAALEIDPDFVEAYADRGIARRAGGDLEGAIADHTKAIELDPRFAGAYYNRASARKANGDATGAIADYGKAIELQPRWTAPYVNRGADRQSLGDLKGAIEDYSEAVTLDPKFAAAWFNRGLAREALASGEREQELLKAAAADFAEALKVAGPSWPHQGIAEKAQARVRERIKK